MERERKNISKRFSRVCCQISQNTIIYSAVSIRSVMPLKVQYFNVVFLFFCKLMFCNLLTSHCCSLIFEELVILIKKEQLPMQGNVVRRLVQHMNHKSVTLSYSYSRSRKFSIHSSYNLVVT